MRVAYMSSDFHAHPLGRFVQSMFAQHDRSRFEVFCVSTRVPSHDAVEQRIRAGCEHWIDASARVPFDVVANDIRSKGVDILVDLNGWTLGRRTKVFAYQPAPIQMLHSWVSPMIAFVYVYTSCLDCIL